MTGKNDRWNEHKDRAEMENISFLLDECKLHPDQVAKRLGMTRNALDKKIERSRKRAKSDPTSVSEDRASEGGGQVPTLRVLPGGRVAPPEGEGGS